jgi:hypothetical protein
MPQCIFCNLTVPHKIGPEKSICLDCLVEMRRFELANGPEVMKRVLPDRVIQALRRIRATDPNQMSNPAVQEQMRRDLEVVQEVLPY